MIQPNEYQHHTIWTPELVEVSLPLAGIGRRVIAMVVDIFLLSLVVFALWILVTLFCVALVSYLPQSSTAVGIIYIAFIFLGTLPVMFIYFWAFHAYNNGQTIGKMWFNIRVVTDRGGRINAWTSFIRSIFDFLDFGLFGGGISAMIILMTEREKRIADFAAGTIVILDK